MSAWALAGLVGLTCLTCSTAQARPTAYGVAIGNNAPPLQGRGDLARLRFADDDAVRFHQFFTRFADSAWLLSVLDEETQKRYPQMLGVAQPPTLRALRAVIGDRMTRGANDPIPPPSSAVKGLWGKYGRDRWGRSRGSLGVFGSERATFYGQAT